MSVGLSLSGSYPVSGFLAKGPSPTEWLTTFQQWLAEREGAELVSAAMVEGPDGEVLLAQLHPFAEELQVSCPRLGEVVLTAATGSCGAGYHEHVVELAHAIASELKVRWRPEADADDTGFFTSGDRDALEKAMVEHVAELAREITPAAALPQPLLLSPASPGFTHDGAVSTPLGPRPPQWLQRVAEGERCALDAQPWRERGRGPAYFRDRAISLSWTEMRWRPPVNEAEEGVMREIARCLHEASAAGATDLPWREWQAIRELLGDESDDGATISSRAAAATGALVGYRRGDVIVRLPGDFTMRLPGSFSDELDEDGTWHGSDGERTVYASATRLPPVADTPGDAARALLRTTFEGEAAEFRNGRVAGKAGLREDTDDDGSKLWVLGCGAAEGAYLLRATIVFKRESDRDWALAAFRSIGRGGPAEIQGALPSVL